MSDEGISYRQSWLRQVMDGKAKPAHPETKLLLTRDCLLDATLMLFDECQQNPRTNHVAKFVSKYKDATSEIREARIVPSDFEVLDLVGRGQFGKVELVRPRQGPTNTVYALKTVPKKMATDPSMAMSVWEERDILTQANSQWLTQAHFAFQDAANLYLVMDYLPGGDLFSLMRRQEDLFTEDNVRFYFVEILNGANAVHHMGYVHRDIKPENILLDQRGHLKLVDFGSAVRLGSSASGHCVGTASYMSPEVLRAADPDNKYTIAPEVDYWSLGIVLYEMLYFRNPFVSDDEVESSIEIIRNIMDWRNTLVFDEDIFQISDACRSLILNLICDCEQRFGYKEVTEHAFLRSAGLTQISEMTPPFIPQVSGDDDTSNFEPPALGPSLVETRQGRTSFAGGDTLSQVAFLGYTYSSSQMRTRKTRARTSLALEGLPVSTLETKWADRAATLRTRCKELEDQVTELQEKLRRAKPETAEVGVSADDEKENHKDTISEKRLRRGKPGIRFADEVNKELRHDDSISDAGHGYLVTNQLRHENTKLKRLFAGLNAEVEKQRTEIIHFKAQAGRHADIASKSKERVRELESRLRTTSRRRSMQARRVDEACADEHRQMLLKMREQNDMIAMLEGSKQTLQKELEISQKLSHTLNEELQLHKSQCVSDTSPDYEEQEYPQHTSKTPKRSDERAVSSGERRGPTSFYGEEFCANRPGHSSTPCHPRQREMTSLSPADSSTSGQGAAVPLLDSEALKESLLERDQVVIELTRQVADLLKELNTSRVDQCRSKATEEELRATVEKYEGQVRQVTSENKTLQQKYERMCIEKVDKYDENRTLKKLQTDLESEATSLRVEVEKLRSAKAAVMSSADENRQRVNRLEAQVSGLTASNNSLLAETKQQAEELLAIRARAERAEKSVAERERELAESLAAVQQQRETAVADARAKKIALSEANALLASSRQREKSWREQAESATRRSDELRARLNAAERSAVEQGASAARAVAQEKELENMQRKLQQESEALKAAELKLQDVNGNLESSRVMNEVLQERVKELDDVERRYKSLNADTLQLRQQLRSKDERCDRLELRLQQTVSKLETERSTGVDQRAKEAAEASERMNDLRARLRSELNETKRRCETQESRVAQLNIEVSQLTRVKQSLEAEVDSLTKRVTASEEEGIRLKEECAQHITSLHLLRREVVGLQREVDQAEDAFDVLSSAKTQVEACLEVEREAMAVDRVRLTSTIEQQTKLINMLHGDAENAAASKRKKQKKKNGLFGSNRNRRQSGPCLSSAALQAMKNEQPKDSTKRASPSNQ